MAGGGHGEALDGGAQDPQARPTRRPPLRGSRTRRRPSSDPCSGAWLPGAGGEMPELRARPCRPWTPPPSRVTGGPLCGTWPHARSRLRLHGTVGARPHSPGPSAGPRQPVRGWPHAPLGCAGPATAAFPGLLSPRPGPARATPSPALSAGTVGGMAALAGAAGVTLAGCEAPRGRGRARPRHQAAPAPARPCPRRAPRPLQASRAFAGRAADDVPTVATFSQGPLPGDVLTSQGFQRARFSPREGCSGRGL